MDHPAYAEMRKYLKLDKKYEDWYDLKMEWIHHHNPDLVIFGDDGKTEKERIDLQGFTAERLEALLEEKGFMKK